MDARGRAIGVSSTLELAPHPLGNNFGDLGHELAYLHAHTSSTGVQLVPGTQPLRDRAVEGHQVLVVRSHCSPLASARRELRSM
jgi:hypothetical protein